MNLVSGKLADRPPIPPHIARFWAYQIAIAFGVWAIVTGVVDLITAHTLPYPSPGYEDEPYATQAAATVESAWIIIAGVLLLLTGILKRRWIPILGNFMAFMWCLDFGFALVTHGSRAASDYVTAVLYFSTAYIFAFRTVTFFKWSLPVVPYENVGDTEVFTTEKEEEQP